MGQALDFSRQALDAYRRAHDGDHPELAYALKNRAGWLTEQGEFEIAEQMLNEAMAMNARILPEGHPDIGISQSDMAVLLLETGRPEQALEMSMSANEILTEAFGEEHWRTAWARSLQGDALVAMGQFADAEPLLVDSFNLLQVNGGARPAQVQAALDRVISLYESWGRQEQARAFVALRETDN